MYHHVSEDNNSTSMGLYFCKVYMHLFVSVRPIIDTDLAVVR